MPEDQGQAASHKAVIHDSKHGGNSQLVEARAQFGLNWRSVILSAVRAACEVEGSLSS